MLSGLAIGLYLFQGGFDVIRSQVLVRVGARLDKKVAPLAHRVAIDMPRFGFSTSEALERGRDVDTVRGFLGSQGPIGPVRPAVDADLPGLRLLPASDAGRADHRRCVRSDRADGAQRNHDEAPRRPDPQGGDGPQHHRRFQCAQCRSHQGDGLRRTAPSRASTTPTPNISNLQTRTNDITGTFAAISRVLRMMLQSAVLGLGAYLTIKGELSAGAIIACSVASSRALAPVDLAIGNWKAFVAARMAYQRLRDTVVALAGVEEPMKLPAPTRGVQRRQDHGGGSGLRPGDPERRRFRAQGRPGARHHRPKRRRQDDAGAGA